MILRAGPDEAGSHRKYEVFAEELASVLGRDRIRTSAVERELYSYDASLERALPDLVVIPRDSTDVSTVVAAARRQGVPYVMRGSGTGYSGGALATYGGVVILTRDLDQILEINLRNRTVRCEPGVVLAELQEALVSQGLRYLPDPSSYRACTLGGTVAENAGGPHALGFGPTSNFVTGLELLLPDGTQVHLDETDVHRGGLDIRALMVGAEGTLGLVTAMTLRVEPLPEEQRVVVATFPRQEAAVAMVDRVMRTGLTPTAMDMLTGAYLPRIGESDDDPSVVYLDFEGPRSEVIAQTEAVSMLAADLSGEAATVKVSAFLRHRADLVHAKVRKMVGRTNLPRYYLFDCVAPRGHLSELMESLRNAADRYNLPLLNTFHAGDGNVHPAPFYDPRLPDHEARLRGFLADVLQRCAELGGTISGEHGVGLEKRELMRLFHQPDELEVMTAIKATVDPDNLCNPGKIVPHDSEGPALRRPPADVTDWVKVDEANGVLEIGDRSVTFADCAEALTGSVFELAYEPVGGTPSDSVVDALDQGLPGWREPYRMRARDLVLAITLGGGADEPQTTFGGSCAKDVSGYELRKLAYGARGRLGVLRGVRLRLSARATARRALRLPVTDAAMGLRLAEWLAELRLPIGLIAVIGSLAEVAVVVVLETYGGKLDDSEARLLSLLDYRDHDWQALDNVLAGWWGDLPRGTKRWVSPDQLFQVEGTWALVPAQRSLWTTGAGSIGISAPVTALSTRVAAAVSG